ncbi:hypothetical protein KAP53_001619 [Salmonella enterica subsp. enterica serovar Infantis]|nr:hypothetical protein [Salmonella enterica subsp. enterica serovar Infantis]
MSPQARCTFIPKMQWHYPATVKKTFMPPVCIGAEFKIQEAKLKEQNTKKLSLPNSIKLISFFHDIKTHSPPQHPFIFKGYTLRAFKKTAPIRATVMGIMLTLLLLVIADRLILLTAETFIRIVRLSDHPDYWFLNFQRPVTVTCYGLYFRLSAMRSML